MNLIFHQKQIEKKGGNNMQIQITAKNINITEAIRNYTNKKLSKLDKYLNKPLDINVLLEVQKNVHLVEILARGSGVILKGRESSEDLYASIDLAMDKIDRQLIKYKEKLKNKKFLEKDYEEPFKLNVFDVDSFDEDLPKVIITKSMPAKPMNVEEAVMQMDLLNKFFFVFKNANSSEINIVYKRDDGNIGLIEP